MRQGNLAIDLRTREVAPVHRAHDARRHNDVKPGIELREKLFYLAVVVIIVLVAGAIMSRYALISQYNYEIQKTTEQIVSIQEGNKSLQLKIDELSSPERIKKIAENEMGMTANETTVRVFSHRN